MVRRTDMTGEVANQALYLPGVVPKLPGRIYYLFGKPIETAGISCSCRYGFLIRMETSKCSELPSLFFSVTGKKEELKDKQKAQELYLHVKSEVKRCLDYLKEKREHDPYRSILSRILYQAANGLISEVPTFDP